MPGLYIHIPFCVKKCRYCDFVSFAGLSEAERYVEALLKEMELAARDVQMRFDTIFIGGGTPSVLPVGTIGRILKHVSHNFKPDGSAEITLECNPGTVSKEKLAEYRDSGINRLSVGLQSADDRVLERAGRIHHFAQFDETVKEAHRAGFSNINADIISGLPGQTLKSYLETIETLKKYKLKHISAYSLILEPGTVLYDDVKSGREALPDEDEAWAMQDAGIKALKESGFTRYEISNFALPGFECRHNLNYWKNGEYLGVGVAAHSAVRGACWLRRENAPDLEQYFRMVSCGKLPVAKKTEVKKEEEMFETVMLGLRLLSGVDLARFEQRFGVPLNRIYKNALDKLIRKGWLQHTDVSINLTEKGLDMQNAALLEFM